jgi:DNA-binding MarR family transcriptional regulator
MLRFSTDETVRLDSAKRLTKRPDSLTVQSNAPTNQTPNNLTGDLTTKQDRVIAFLDANPGDYTVRELADLTDVSTYTASKGLQAHKKYVDRISRSV